MSKLEIAKKIIKENFEQARCGLFDCRNTAGDLMHTLYCQDKLRIDICYRWEYFEVFGLTYEEFEKLSEYYVKLRAN